MPNGDGRGFLAGLRERVATWMVKDYDANWFVRFLKLADEEDWAGQKVTDAYQQHAWVNIAVTAIARNIARAEFKQYRGEDEIPEADPLWKLFNDVNPYMSRYQLWEATVSWKKICGEAIWVFEPGYSGPPKLPQQIYVMDPRGFQHVLDPEKQNIVLWKWGEGPDAVSLLPTEVIHFHDWNKWDKFRGRNPLVALDDEIEMDLLANASNKALLSNRSEPPGILSAEKPLTKEQAVEIREMWEKQHKGARNAYRTAVLGYGTKYQQIGLSPKDLEYLALKKWDREAILARYGVPPAAVGLKDEASPLSGKDTSEQMRGFWELSLIPEIKSIEDVLRTEFYNRFGLKGLRGEFDLSGVGELQDNKDAVQMRFREDVKAGLLTINEVREQMDLDPVDWGDTWWVPLGLSPADQAMKEPEPVPPQLQPGKPPAKPEEEEEEETLSGLFQKGKRPRYTQAYKDRHWEKLIRNWEPLEKKFARELKAWLYKQRSRQLEVVATRWKDIRDGYEELFDDDYWKAEMAELRAVAERHYMLALSMSGEELAVLFADLGIGLAVGFDIFSTEAVSMLKTRVTKVTRVAETVKEAMREKLKPALEQGWTMDETANAIRETYNMSQNRAETIARTELGGVINDSRIAAYMDVGLTEHTWITAKDERVRESHRAVDGESVKIGQPFSNGLLYPNDPQGPPEEVIACRCITLPEVEG